jgi:basic amino acid/polyamine antiporter, APA family
MSYKDLFRKKSATAIVQEGGDGEHSGLHKVLNVRDLTFFGIAAIIGGGTFSAIGNACFSGGPAVILLYIICAVACGFTALCYAEFAARVPVSGSAYTYAYVSFGELFAWVIGWALLMEYSIGNIYIAFSWSGYFTNLLEGFGLHLPAWLTINYTEAHRAVTELGSFSAEYAQYIAGNVKEIKDGIFMSWMNSDAIQTSMKEGKTLLELYSSESASRTASEGYVAFMNSPVLGGLHIVFDMPGVLINVLITWLVFIGTKESRNISNLMVMIKLAVVILVILVGFFYIDIDNWTPFMPNGFSGVMSGVSAVFFAYIGFDAVSTLAEECKDPQRDLPKGMIYSLIICTIVYIILALVLTGMVSYTLLGVSDPLAEIFALKGVKWMLFIVSIAAVVAMTSVMLVFQMGQPRIWMTMSRDGLLPKRFAKIHPKYKTPGFATVITGLVVGLPMFFTDESFILDFTSIGTLFAFVLVCGGVLMLPTQHSEKENQEATKGKFRLPYINSKYIFPAIIVCTFSFLIYQFPDFFVQTFDLSNGPIETNLPMIAFFIVCLVMTVLSYLKNLSLIPVLGLVSCCYLLTGMAASNWVWFSIWLSVGLVVYFLYSRKHSKLAKK